MQSIQIELPVNVEICIWESKTGKLLDLINAHNLAVLSGRNLLRDFLNGDTVSGLNYFALGTGSTPESAADSALVSEILRDTITLKTLTNGCLNLKYYLSSGIANGLTLNEAGLFGNGATVEKDSGTLYARVVHTPIEKTASIAITYSWDCGFTV